MSTYRSVSSLCSSSTSSISSDKSLENVSNVLDLHRNEHNIQIRHIVLEYSHKAKGPNETESCSCIGKSAQIHYRYSPVLSQVWMTDQQELKHQIENYLNCSKMKTHKDFVLPDFCVKIFKQEGFMLQEEIGHGTYGKVYKTVRISTQSEPNNKSQTEFPCSDRVCAVKVIDTGRLSKQYKHKFLCREISALLTIPSHPNIVHIFDLFKSSASSGDCASSQRKLINIVMEYCPNGDMYNYLVKRQFIPEAYACRWFRQLLCAVAHIHRHGFAHRDLKLENLLFDTGYNLKITDFGFCTKLEDSSLCCKCHKSRIANTLPTSSTGFVEQRSETFCGSVLYTSPELLQGLCYQATLNDVWSCGVILYLMLYANYPVESDQFETLQQADPTFCPIINYPQRPPVSTECREVFDRIFVTESKRSTVEQLLQMDWIKYCSDELPFSLTATKMEDIAEHFENLNIPRQETLSFICSDTDTE